MRAIEVAWVPKHFTTPVYFMCELCANESIYIAICAGFAVTILGLKIRCLLA